MNEHKRLLFEAYADIVLPMIMHARRAFETMSSHEVDTQASVLEHGSSLPLRFANFSSLFKAEKNGNERGYLLE